MELSNDNLKYRISPWWRHPLRDDFPYVQHLRSNIYLDHNEMDEAKRDRSFAEEIIDGSLEPGNLRYLVEILSKEMAKVPEALKAQPIYVVYPRRPRLRQNHLAEVFTERATKLLGKEMPYKFVACHELFNISSASRTQYKPGPLFHLRSRVASPTLFSKGDDRKLFLFTDDSITQGDTAAEVASFIANNGGILLTATAFHSGWPNLRPTVKLKKDFDKKYPEHSPQRQRLEDCLVLMGLTIEALTFDQMNNFAVNNLSLDHLETKIKGADPVPELTTQHRIFFDEIKAHHSAATGKF